MIRLRIVSVTNMPFWKSNRSYKSIKMKFWISKLIFNITSSSQDNIFKFKSLDSLSEFWLPRNPSYLNTNYYRICSVENGNFFTNSIQAINTAIRFNSSLKFAGIAYACWRSISRQKSNCLRRIWTRLTPKSGTSKSCGGN
jgi:hypothetical protein